MANVLVTPLDNIECSDVVNQLLLPQMEYGLWNLPGGFWGSTTGSAQGQMPPDALSRPYYAPAVFHSPINETSEGAVSYGLTGSQSYRHQTEFIKTGAMTNSSGALTGMPPISGRTSVHDERNGDAVTSLNLPPNNPTGLVEMNGPPNCVASEEKPNDIKVKNSPQWDTDEHPIKMENTANLEYLAQQSYQHPMYNMLFAAKMGDAGVTTTPTTELKSSASTMKPNVSQQTDTDDEDEDVEEDRRTLNVAVDGANSPLSQTPESSASSSQTTAVNPSTTNRTGGYECGECGLVADTRPALKKHLELSHRDTISDNSPIILPKPAATTATTCPMPFCRFRTVERHEMETHVAQHVAEGFSPSGKKKSCPVALQRVRYEREEYRCQLCAYSCTIEKAFYKHLKVHAQGGSPSTPVVKISCVICGKDRASEVEMNKHMKKHRDDRYFCCDICIFKTVQLKKLIQHRRMHTGEKPHLCPHCSYRSARRDNLRSHVRRVHKKENLYCDTFSPRGLLLTPTPTATSTSASAAESGIEVSGPGASATTAEGGD